MEHVIIKVFLYEIEPQIWRRFSIPSNFSFGQFHKAIQSAMGWLDLQDHEFLHGKGKNMNQIIGVSSNSSLASFQNENDLTLSQFIGRKKLPLRMLYRYDLVEDWIHEIVFEAKEANASLVPLMITGERACPIEDSGGPWEYKACLRGESDWMESSFDPESFDPKTVKFK
jgi:hypothetical protein